MTKHAEYLAIFAIAICLSLASGYLWGYAAGAYDNACLVFEGEK